MIYFCSEIKKISRSTVASHQQTAVTHYFRTGIFQREKKKKNKNKKLVAHLLMNRFHIDRGTSPHS